MIGRLVGRVLLVLALAGGAVVATATVARAWAPIDAERAEPAAVGPWSGPDVTCEPYPVPARWAAARQPQPMATPGTGEAPTTEPLAAAAAQAEPTALPAVAVQLEPVAPPAAAVEQQAPAAPDVEAVPAAAPADVVVVSRPAFTAPGAVLPIEMTISGTAAAKIYARYSLEHLLSGDASHFRTPDAPGRPGLNLLQWEAPAPRQPTDAVWYNVVVEPQGAAAPAQSADDSIPFGRWLNAGGDNPFPDSSGIFWEPDRPYYQDAYGYEGATQVITTGKGVRGTGNYGEEDLCQHQRASIDGSPFHYRFYYGPGIYQARLQIDLRFAELQYSEPGQRVFDVVVDGQPLVTGLDLCAVAGPGRAYGLTREVTVTSRLGADPTVDIAFIPRVGEACVAGVGVRSLSAMPQYSAAAQVARSPDDAHAILEDGGSDREPFVRFGHYSDGAEYAAGLLFRQLAVPRGAFISSAWLELWSYPPAGGQHGQADVTIYAQAADSARPFNWNQPRVSARPLTAAGIRWLIDRSWPANEGCQSPDIAAAVQEVVDRPQWKPGNNLALLLMPNGGDIGWRDIVAEDWPGDKGTGSKAAILHVTYVPPLYRPPATP